MASRSSMSGLVGTGNNIWSGIYVVSSTIGFIILFGLMEAFYVTPFNVKCWWFKGLLFVMCMILSVAVFGGGVIFLWYQWEIRASNHKKYTNDHERSDLAWCNPPKMQNNATESNIASMNTIHYGCRPNFPGIFIEIIRITYIACKLQCLSTPRLDGIRLWWWFLSIFFTCHKN